MKVWKRLMVVSVLACFLLSSTLVFAETAKLTILHTNDHHGHFMKSSSYAGGLAAQSTLVNIVRAEVTEAGGVVLLLSAGDVNMGTPESDMLDAQPDFTAMSVMGYDAMSPGNHDFDKPYADVLMKQKDIASFPFLSANIVKKDTGEALFDAYVIKEFEGLKVAILGLTTEETPVITNPKNVADLEFKNAIETASALVPKLREEADVVIALTHLGFNEGGYGYEGYEATSDVELAKAVEGIDVIVGGHSHTVLEQAEVVGKTLIVQAGSNSDFVGRLDLVIDTEANTITESASQLLPVNKTKQVTFNEKRYTMYAGPAYFDDADVVDALAPFTAQADELLSQPIGEALVRLDGDRELVRSQETNMGNLITDAQRAKVGADIAFLNGGGIRAPLEAGPLTYRDVLTVQPFGNKLVVLDLTGAQVMETLNYAATVSAGQGAFVHVSGLKWTNNKGVAENVMVGDAPIDLAKTYTAVTNNFMAAGGDGYTVFKDLPQYDTGFVDADALKEYIEQMGKVEPKVEGRLTVIQ